MSTLKVNEISCKIDSIIGLPYPCSNDIDTLKENIFDDVTTFFQWRNSGDYITLVTEVSQNLFNEFNLGSTEEEINANIDKLSKVNDLVRLLAGLSKSVEGVRVIMLSEQIEKWRKLENEERRSDMTTELYEKWSKSENKAPQPAKEEEKVTTVNTPLKPSSAVVSDDFSTKLRNNFQTAKKQLDEVNKKGKQCKEELLSKLCNDENREVVQKLVDDLISLGIEKGATLQVCEQIKKINPELEEADNNAETE